GTLTFTPKSTTTGSATVSVVAQDNGGTANGGVNKSGQQTFTITTTNGNQAPVITGVSSTYTVAEDQSITINFTVTDPEAANADGFVYSLSSTNTGLLPNSPATNGVFNGSGNSRTLALYPVADSNGTTRVTISVTDTGTPPATATAVFTLTVSARNDAPSFTINSGL